MKGKIGASTQMVNAAKAGCSFKLTKRERERLAAVRRQHRELQKLRSAHRFDPTPRLTK